MSSPVIFNGTPVVPSPANDSGVHTCENGGIASDAANQLNRQLSEAQAPTQHVDDDSENRIRDKCGVDLDSSNVPNHVNSTDLRRSYADYWARFEWTHFLVLTPATEFSRDRLSREFRRYVNRIRRLTKNAPIAWLRVIERGRGGRCHLHALIWTSFPLAVRHLELAWDRGHAHVRRFNADLDGVAYLLKEFSTDEWGDAYDWSADLPPLRDTACQGEVSDTSQVCKRGNAPPRGHSVDCRREPLPGLSPHSRVGHTTPIDAEAAL